MSVQLRLRHGPTRPLALDDWYAPATPDEMSLLRTLSGPVLDLGCGPGRLVVALNELGTPALGIDASPNALRHAAQRGAAVLRYSVFDPLPGEGRWATVLLFDGNIGIGGDPTLLLERVARLLSPQGCAVVEVEPAGHPSLLADARLERDGEATAWFPWAFVTTDSIGELARSAALEQQETLIVEQRTFTVLRKQNSRQS